MAHFCKTMTISRINYLILFFILLGLTFSGCKSKQRIVYSSTPVEEKNHDALFRDILTESFSYNTFSARLNMSLTSGTRSLSSRANIRIVKDSALQVSIQPLFGVEMFRIYIDPDTMVFLDRMNKRYVKESIASLKEHYPVGFDYYTLQSVFTNALFVSGKESVEPTDYRKFSYTRTPNRNYYLTTEDMESGIEYSFTVDGDDRITFTHLMQPKEKYSLQWSYGNFAVLDQSTFPHKMNASIASANRKIHTELLFSDIVINEPIQLSMQVPNSYTETSISEIIKIIAPSQ